MEFKYFIFILLVFITCARCDDASEAAEPLECAKNSEFITYLLSKVDSLQLQLHSLQLTIKDEKQLMIEKVDNTGEKIEALRVSQSQQFNALKANLTQDLQKLNTEYTKDMQLILDQINKISRDKASTYVRWGKTTCAGNDTEKVYSGFTSGSPHHINGGAASFICLPQNPTWAKYIDGIQNIGGYVSGTEYEIFDVFKPFPRSMGDQDAPCVVCRPSRQTTITIPGRTDCEPGWTTEYTGYLMTGHYQQGAATDYACVDADPEAVYHGGANLNGKLFYFTEVKCGSLPCQEYPDGRELACVVCSK